MESLIWLILMAGLLIVEIITLGLTSIWFAAGALIALLASLLGAPLYIQIALFAVVSLVLLFFTRPFATKYLNSKTTKTNAEELVGKTAEVTMTIDNIKAEGQVMVNGLEWTARSTQDSVSIEKGALVRIVGISGVKLIVEKKEGNE